MAEQILAANSTPRTGRGGLQPRIANITFQPVPIRAGGIEPPYAVLVSLIGIAGAQLNFARVQGGHWWDDLSDPLERDQYHFDEVIFETIPTTPAECASMIRPIIDQIANTGGKATSPVFDEQGRYIPLRRS